MNILKITDDSLQLSSGLPQNSFAKTDMDKLLGEKNIIIHVKKDSVTSEDYFFEGTKVDSEENTLFEGKCFKGEFLSDILEKDSFSEKDLLSIMNFSRAIDFILNNQENFGGTHFDNGATAVIIKTDADGSDILFLSENLFESCALNHRKAYSEIQGKYLYKGLDYEQSLCFLRGTVSYKALTGHFPFENEDTGKRQEDIFDENFIPMELWDESIDKNLAKSIEAALKSKITQKILAGKKNLSDVKAERKKQELLENARKFEPDLLLTELKRITESKGRNDENLAKKRDDFLAQTKKYLKVKRFWRRYKSRILTAAAAIFFLSWGASGIIKQNGKLITTKGMTSLEAIHAYYSTIHNLDVPNLQETIKGKKTRDLFQRISAYYVTSKQRLQVQPDNATVTPAKWFFYRNVAKNWMFGITKLKIDGKEFASDGKFTKRNEKPRPLTEENGRPLQEGDEITHEAEYYLIEQQEGKIFIQKINDTITLRYTGKRWRVVNADGKATVSDIKAKDFVSEYNELIGKSELDSDSYSESQMEEELTSESKIKEAIESLRAKYDWIPYEDDIIYAANFLSNEYGSIEAEKYLQAKQTF